MFAAVLVISLMALPVFAEEVATPSPKGIGPTVSEIRKGFRDEKKALMQDIQEKRKTALELQKAELKAFQEKWQEMLKGKTATEKATLIPTMMAEKKLLKLDVKTAREEVRKETRSAMQTLKEKIMSTWASFWQGFRK